MMSRQNKVRLCLVVIFFLGLALFHLLEPLVLTLEIAKMIFSSTLSLSGILIAVVGIMLSMYISQGLNRTEVGKDFQMLLGILTFSLLISL